MIKGSIVALVTPFDSNNDIDYTALDKLCQLHLEANTDSILLLGTTAEAEALSKEEKIKLVNYVYDKVYPKIKIMVGLISNKYNEVLDMARDFDGLDIDSYLIISPYYIKTNSSGLLKYFTYLADRLNKPIILYNVPKRVGMEIPIDVVSALSYHNNIIGIKDASGSLLYQQEIINKCKDEFLYYCGDDFILIPSLLMGADGVISVIGNAFPKEIKYICENKVPIKQFKRIYNLISYMYSEVSPIGIKYVLYLLGYISLKYRMPLDEPNKDMKRKLEGALLDILKK